MLYFTCQYFTIWKLVLNSYNLFFSKGCSVRNKNTNELSLVLEIAAGKIIKTTRKELNLMREIKLL
jgi:hypothetical protein